MTIDNDTGTKGNNKILCSIYGNYSVNVLTIYPYALSEEDKNISQLANVIMHNMPVDERIEFIVKKSFSHSFFYKDPVIDNSITDGLYSRWIRNAFFREDEYFVLSERKKGFILFSEMNDGLSIDIELIAVDDNERKKGTAGKMISSSKIYAVNKGYSYINVSMQADNIGAVNPLYTARV